MRIHVIACRVFQRELCFLASQSQNIIDVTFLPQGLHDTPVKLNRMLAETIDSVYTQFESRETKYRPDAIALAYGLCSNGVIGLECRDIPLVIPRCDDCIALFLGSQQLYLKVFASHNGTYWFNNGWVEQAFVPTKKNLDLRRAEYAEAYGEDNADYLMEQMEGWQRNYSCAGYISSPFYDNPRCRELALEAAEYNSWDFDELKGDPGFLSRLLSGDWNQKEFLVLKPGQRVAQCFDGGKIRAEDPES